MSEMTLREHLEAIRDATGFHQASGRSPNPGYHQFAHLNAVAAIKILNEAELLETWGDRGQIGRFVGDPPVTQDAP